jgi:hypothetical protein
LRSLIPDYPILVAVDEQAFDEYVKASLAQDTIGLKDLIIRGRLLAMLNSPTVLVIDTGFGHQTGHSALKVRILDGDYAGSAGWVVKECVEAP